MGVKKRNIVIADDELGVAQGFAKILEEDPSLYIQAIITDYDSIVKDVKDLEVDLLLLDINFRLGRNSINLLKELKREDDFLIIMLTSHDSENVKAEAFKNGADGFIEKYRDLEELNSLIKGYLNGTIKVVKMPQSIISITKREYEILNLLFIGKAEKEIAEELKIDITTVKTHKKHLFEKLNVQKQSELIKTCLDNDILMI